MAQLIWIDDAKYLGGYSLLLTFNDGAQKKVDLDYLVKKPGSIFSPLCDTEKFCDFKLDGWTVTWLNGSLDVAPERLYEVGR